MADNCPRCGKEMLCLGGCSAHPSNWYCSDEKGCGHQAWNPQAGAQVMAMTLEQVLDSIRAMHFSSDSVFAGWAEAIESHPTQPAQAVDVGAIREVIDWLTRQEGMRVDPDNIAEQLTRALAGEKAEGWRVPDGWREAFEDCYMRANEVGILHRDDGEYTSVLTKVAWALWNERARLSPIDWWHASHDSEARAWTIHSPSGDSCEVHERASGPHAEILRQLAQSLPASPTPDKEG